MAQIVWDLPSDRYYEAGVDRGVLYFPSSPGKYDNGVPWNGLTSIEEDFSDDNFEPFYYDGVKHNQIVEPGNYKATLSAYTYPDEFDIFTTRHPAEEGFYIDNQFPSVFGLCYRTLIGTSFDSAGVHYKLHLVYNITARENDVTYSTQEETMEPIEFSWDLYTVPETGFDYRPTAHVIIDSRYFSKELLTLIEDILYGRHTAVDNQNVIDNQTPFDPGFGFLDGGTVTSDGADFVDGNPGSSDFSVNPRLPSLRELLGIIKYYDPKFVVPNTISGVAALIRQENSDLTMSATIGVYHELPTNRFISSNIHGVYGLGQR